jgi:putative CocE/NonD family hydrolase
MAVPPAGPDPCGRSCAEGVRPCRRSSRDAVPEGRRVRSSNGLRRAPGPVPSLPFRASGRDAANLEWLTEIYGHTAYDEFWKARSFVLRASEIDIPTLHGGVWYDHFGRGTLTTHEAIDVPKQLFMSPGSLATRDDLGDGGFTQMQVAWFDQFLRGADSGVLDGPAARIYLMGAEHYVDEPIWPVPTIETVCFLRAGPAGSAQSLNDGGLGSTPGGKGSSTVIDHDPGHANRAPRDVRDQRSFEARCLTFTSPPLATDVEVVGAPRLMLYASTTATDLDWCVRLCDVDEDGRSKLLNTGALKGSHVRSHEEPEPLRPGEVYCFEIEVWPIANLFKGGHRIRVDVSASDFPSFGSNPLPSRTRVLQGPDYPSRLVLPVTLRSQPLLGVAK